MSNIPNRYLTAAVCIKGHVASEGIELGPPEGKFCSSCGAAVISNCPTCKAPIRGYYHVAGILSTAPYHPPAHCADCGAAFPWTAEKLAAAKDLADELENLSADDRAKLKSAIDDIAGGGSRAEVGAARIKRLLGKAGTAVGQAIWRISIEVASEAAKKVLTGG